MVCHGEKSSRFPPSTRFLLSCDPLTWKYSLPSWMIIRVLEIYLTLWGFGCIFYDSMVSVGLNFKGTQARNIALKPAAGVRMTKDPLWWLPFSYRIKMKRSQRLPLQVSSKNIKSKCLEIGKSTGCCLDLFLKIMPDVHWTNQKYRVAKKKPTIWWRSFFFSFLDTLPISPQFHHDLTRGPITIHQP